MKSLWRFLPCTLPLTYLVLCWTGGGLAMIVPSLLMFVGVPIADLLVGEDRSDPDDRNAGELTRTVAAAAPVGYVVLHLASLAAGLHHASLGPSVVELIASAISLGAIGSIGISAAHELVHKKDTWSKFWGRSGLVAVAYLHFEVSHIYGHHRNVGTAKDMSTAWYGESAYAFVARALPGCFRLAWTLQVDLLRRAGRGAWHSSNLVIWAVALPSVIGLMLVVTLGVPALVVYGVAAFLAVFLLEVVSYIEHYGLMRERDARGRTRRVEAHHSWDSYYAVSGAMSFMLQRHADHHRLGTRAYNNLEILEGTPELPLGYPAMIALALCPPVWRRIMHPRLAALGASGGPGTGVPRSADRPDGEIAGASLRYDFGR